MMQMLMPPKIEDGENVDDHVSRRRNGYMPGDGCVEFRKTIYVIDLVDYGIEWDMSC